MNLTSNWRADYISHFPDSTWKQALKLTHLTQGGEGPDQTLIPWAPRREWAGSKVTRLKAECSVQHDPKWKVARNMTQNKYPREENQKQRTKPRAPVIDRAKVGKQKQRPKAKKALCCF